MTSRSPIPCRPGDLAAYHYGDLDGVCRHEMERHLEQCGDCRRELTEIERTLDLFETPGLELSPAEIERFADRVVCSVRPRPWRRAAWGTALAAAAVLAIVLGRQIPEEAVAPPAGGGVVAEMELLENLDLLQDLDLLEVFEELQELEELG